MTALTSNRYNPFWVSVGMPFAAEASLMFQSSLKFFQNLILFGFDLQVVWQRWWGCDGAMSVCAAMKVGGF